MNAITQNIFIDDLLASVGETHLKLNDFNFTLPDHYIARTPRPERSSGRLLHLDKITGNLIHNSVSRLAHFFNEGDLLVFNDTRIIPSHLFAKTDNEETIELFVERVLDNTHMLARIFKNSQLCSEDSVLIDTHQLKITAVDGEFYALELINSHQTLWEIIDAHGKLAFPTYFQRDANATDEERFQTIYAKNEGSVSAPSAGFHFDEALFQTLREKNIAIGYVTLHVGSGTSAPIHVDDISQHKMHTEWLQVSDALCDLVKKTKANGNKVIAIGTTSLRALETASQSGEINPYLGYTDIFIRPGHQFQCVDGLFTNFHLPRSTLMILISALAGYQQIRDAYQVAIKENYRFLAYGDAMLIT